MARSRRSVELSDGLWASLEVMSREMSVDIDSLLNQAVFTFARFNGYVTPGPIAAHVASASIQVVDPDWSAADKVLPKAKPMGAGDDSPTGIAAAVLSVPEEPEVAPEPETTNVAPRAVKARVAERLPPPVDEEPVSLEPRRRPEPEPEPEPEIPEEPPADELPPEVPSSEDLEGHTGEVPSSEAPPDAIDVDVTAGQLADPQVAMLRGAQHEGSWRGRVQLLNEDGAVVSTVELGGDVDEAVLATVLADELREANAWLRLHQDLDGKGHVPEATLALARALGAGASPHLMEQWLAAHAIPLSEEAAVEGSTALHQTLTELTADGAEAVHKAAVVAEALRQGAHAGNVLRELAIDQDQFASAKSAVDFIRCAKLLAPDKKGFYAYTHCLIEMSLGRPDGARVALDELRGYDEAHAATMATYFSAMFPTYDFWPKSDGLTTLKLGVKAKPPMRAHPVLRVAVQKSASRVRALRDRLKGLVPKATWLPPDLADLLPKGPLPLKGDDALNLEPWQEANVPQLLRRLRGEWAGLCWLCWLSGLDAVGLPGPTKKPRSSTALRHALSVRQMVLQLKIEGESPEEHLEGPALEQAQAVAQVPWVDVAPDAMDAATAELALDELRVAMLPVLWADDVLRASPWTPEEDANEEAAAESPQAPAEQVPASDRTGVTQAPVAAARDDGERTGMIERTSMPPEVAPELWIEREGLEPQLLSGLTRYTVGREKVCNLVLISPRVSREHAEILVGDDGFTLNDLKSSNGTFVGGERITTHQLADGDQVTFGSEAVVIRFGPR